MSHPANIAFAGKSHVHHLVDTRDDAAVVDRIGLSQTQIAETLGVTKSLLSLIENGKRQPAKEQIIRGKRGEVLGTVLASDADEAIKRAIVTFEITNPHHQKCLVAQPVA